jgi:hypothetical protein
MPASGWRSGPRLLHLDFVIGYKRRLFEFGSPVFEPNLKNEKEKIDCYVWK